MVHIEPGVFDGSEGISHCRRFLTEAKSAIQAEIDEKTGKGEQPQLEMLLKHCCIQKPVDM